MYEVKGTMIRLAACAALTLALQGAGFAAARYDDKVEKAVSSNLIPVKLPDGSLRFMGDAERGKFEEMLTKIAEINHGKIVKFEVLVWTSKDCMKLLPERVKDWGYSFTTQAAFDAEPGKITPVTVVKKDSREKKDSLLGIWIEKDNLALLIWGAFKPDGAEATSKAPTAERTDAQPAQAAGKVTSDVFGDWSWTTVSSVGYQNKVTGQLAAPSGMSAKFTFTKDGRYKKFFYIRQQTYNLVTESTTTEEGTVEFNTDGTFITKPSKGHYDGHTGSRIINRDMTDTERKPTTWYWEWRNVDGKKQLYLGPGKEALKLFKRD